MFHCDPAVRVRGICDNKYFHIPIGVLFQCFTLCFENDRILRNQIPPIKLPSASPPNRTPYLCIPSFRGNPPNKIAFKSVNSHHF